MRIQDPIETTKMVTKAALYDSYNMGWVENMIKKKETIVNTK